MPRNMGTRGSGTGSGDGRREVVVKGVKTREEVVVKGEKMAKEVVAKRRKKRKIVEKN